MLAVLAVLAVMALVATVFSQWTHSAINAAAHQQEQINSRIASVSALNAVLYTRFTAQPGPDGVPLPTAGQQHSTTPMFDSLDDFLSGAPPRSYKAEGAVMLKLNDEVLSYGELSFMAQDRGGLIGLAEIIDVAPFTQLASRIEGLSSQQLLDSYFDYTDKDDYRRLHGAETAEYRMQQRGLPMNGVLRTPLQLRDIMFWDRALAGFTDAELLRLFRVDGSTYANVNTATPEVLKLKAGAEMSERLLAMREQTPFASVLDLGGVMQRGEDSPLGISFDQGIRFWYWNKQSMSAEVLDIGYDGMTPGRSALKLHWRHRVALSENMHDVVPGNVEHPLFQLDTSFR